MSHLRQLHRLRWVPRNPANRTKLALTTLAGTALGLSLAAFYILPAATERPFVQITMAVIPGMRIADNTLFHHTGTTEDALAHDAVLHTASLIAILLLTATALALLTAIRTNKKPVIVSEEVHSPTVNPAVEGPAVSALPTSAHVLLPLTLLTATIALLLTPITLPLWHHLPELAFLQFPWRLLAILATAFGLAAALALDRLRLPAALLAMPIAATLALPAAHLFRQPCDAPDTVPARLAQFQSNAGTEPTDEYTPAPADNDALKPNSPPFWLAEAPDAPPPPNATPAPAPRDLDLNSPTPEHLILNLRAYPDWHLQLNGQAVIPDGPRADGLLAVPIPAGLVHLHLTFREPPREQAAQGLSLLAAITLLTLMFRKVPPLDKSAPRQTSRTPDLDSKVQT